MVMQSFGPTDLFRDPFSGEFGAFLSGNSEQSPLFGGDFIRDILESDPRLPFSGRVAQGGFSRSQQRNLQSQFSSIHNRFLGELGRQLLEGQIPNQTFSDFLSGLNLRDELFNLSPSERGQSSQRLAPPVRFLF